MDGPSRDRPFRALDPADLARPRCRPRFRPGFDRLEDRVLPAPAIPLPFSTRQTGSVAEAPVALPQ